MRQLSIRRGRRDGEPNEIRISNLDARCWPPAVGAGPHAEEDTCDDWIEAFEWAVAKRARNGCFIGLSSGYDSGGIACALLNRGVAFKAYSFAGNEASGVLRRQASRVAHEDFVPDPQPGCVAGEHVDTSPTTIVCDGVPTSMRLLDVARRSAGGDLQGGGRRGRRIMLSGQGADEILSDYSPWPGQSELRGTFPRERRLWRNFNYSCQESYLTKEEYIAGAFAFETGTRIWTPASCRSSSGCPRSQEQALQGAAPGVPLETQLPLRGRREAGLHD